MSKDQEYNGWTNWETWNVALWADNEEETYKTKQRFVRGLRIVAWGYFVGHVEHFCKEIYPSGTPDMKDESEMDNVNYQEIADAWQEEYELENE